MLKRTPSGEWSEKREGESEGSWHTDLTICGMRVLLSYVPAMKRHGRSGFSVSSLGIGKESTRLQATTEDEAKREAVLVASKWLQEASNAFREWLAQVEVAS